MSRRLPSMIFWIIFFMSEMIFSLCFFFGLFSDVESAAIPFECLLIFDVGSLGELLILYSLIFGSSFSCRDARKAFGLNFARILFVDSLQ